MIPALTLDEIQQQCNQRYDYDEKRIVAIMVARYTIESIQDMIRSQYEFWNDWTGKSLDIFWLGYGAYAFPGRYGQYLVGNLCGIPSVYFDTRVFVNGINEISSKVNIQYNDSIGILLCNYYNGHIHLDESAYVNINSLVGTENGTKLRSFASNLIRLCKKNHRVEDVMLRLNINKASFCLQDIILSSIVSHALKLMLKQIFSFLS